MNSTPSSKATEPHDALIARADEQLAHARGQIARADEELARVSEQVARMERDAARPPPAGPAPQSSSEKAAPESSVPESSIPVKPVPGKSASGKSSLRAVVGLLLAAGIIVAALVWQSSYGAGAKLMIARWAPQLVSTMPPQNPQALVQPAASVVQVAAADGAPPQAAPLAQAAPQDAAPAAAAAPPDQTQLLQTIAQDLANVVRDIEQLKANQQQIARDNAKAIEELKASQEEMKRGLAKVSEQNPPRASPPPVQPAPAVRRPERPPQSPYARAPPRMPREWMYDDW